MMNMERRKARTEQGDQPDLKQTGEKQTKQQRKVSEYGKQLAEKQKVKEMYGLRERQFRKFFAQAVKKQEGGPGENLLNLLERRLDNTLYRLKMAVSREQARQIIVHGHVAVNNKRVSSPSYLVSVNDVVSLNPKVLEKKAFVEQAIEKRLKMGIKVPDWLELNKSDYQGTVLREPVRSDIQATIEENLIVELYSK